MPAANITPIQLSFNAGELSPRVWMRVDDTKRNRQGLALLENFITKHRGPIKSRDGFKFLGKVIAPTYVSVSPLLPVQVTIEFPDVEVVVGA